MSYRAAVIYSDNLEAVTAYLPSNYRVTGWTGGGTALIVEGDDYSGWTLDGYVLPRLASGLYFGREVDADTLKELR